MPFDALLAPTQPRLLAEILGEYRARPVPLEALAAHKQTQLERFAPSFWHQHQTWLPVGLIGSVFCMAMSGGIANGVLPGSLLPSWLSLFWLGVMTLLIVFGVFRVSAGARWEERVVAAEMLNGLGVPVPIARLARDLQREAPGSALILGELLQQEVVLDPYLLLELGNERICLGIWDERRIVASVCHCEERSDEAIPIEIASSLRSSQ
ncbi:MAG TPA: hypothetical protein VKI44_23395 [Acetobacteraceae bacterium]|nr:hypothetical protein [Acetobacteraceae bacterium]